MPTMASPNNKPSKLVELKWKSRADRLSPKKYNLRNKKKRSTTSSSNKSTQKKINNFFPRSPKHKFNNNDVTQETPVKKPPELFGDNLYVSPSSKYDSLIPKVEDILRAREDEEKFKKIHAIIAESSKRFLEGLEKNKNSQIQAQAVEIPPVIKFNNCKHLSNGQITKRFRKDLKYVDDIFYGRVSNERYELFQNDTPLNNGTKNDLRVNETNIAFTQDQLIHIISLFRKRYDKGNIYKYSNFYFKVLLPEYCLKIYADLYEMTTGDALDYLKTVPVQDLLA